MTPEERLDALFFYRLCHGCGGRLEAASWDAYKDDPPIVCEKCKPEYPHIESHTEEMIREFKETCERMKRMV